MVREFNWLVSIGDERRPILHNMFNWAAHAQRKLKQVTAAAAIFPQIQLHMISIFRLEIKKKVSAARLRLVCVDNGNQIATAIWRQCSCSINRC